MGWFGRHEVLTLVLGGFVVPFVEEFASAIWCDFRGTKRESMTWGEIKRRFRKETRKWPTR
jgi:hypothetical protein